MTNYILSLCVFTFLAVAGCSANQENKEKSTIEKQTEQVANEAVKSIQTPIDKAKTASGKEDTHNQLIKEQEKSQ